MPRYRVKLRGIDAFFIEADHVAYEGPAVILYNESPYAPEYVVMGYEAQIKLVEDK